MSIEIHKEQEFTTSRDYLGSPTAQTAQYLIHGAATEAEAFAKLQVTAASYIDNLALKTYELDEAKGGGAWVYSVNYEKSATSAPGSDGTVQEPQYGFSTGNATKKMISPISHVEKSDNAPVYDGIGWDGKQYNGVDIAKANPTESRTITIAKNKIDTKFKRLLNEMAFTVNKEAFKGWEPGECLFIGANISQTGDQDCTIVYNFAISVNKTDFKIMKLELGDKDGWDYGWAVANQGDHKDKEIILKAKSAYIDRVYPRTDFTKLGLGK